MADIEEIAAVAQQDIFRFLSACYCEPSPIFREEKLLESIGAVADFLDPDVKACATKLAQAFDTVSDQDLLIDYSRLFVGPSRPLAPPYESVWVSPSENLAQEATTQLLALYEHCGFGVADNLADLPDHIAVELEFLYVLSFERNLAASSESAVRVSELTALERRFYSEHLGQWIWSFLDVMERSANTDFYRELARLSRIVLTTAGLTGDRR